MSARERRPRQAAGVARIQILLNALANQTTRSNLNIGNGISIEDLTYLMRSGDDDDSDVEEEDDEYTTPSYSQQWFQPINEPQPKGVECLLSGDFGHVQNRLPKSMRNINLGRLLNDRTSRSHPKLFKEDYASVSIDALPLSMASPI